MASTMKQADAKSGMPIAAQERKKTRRTYAAQFKREIVAQCLQTGASVSAIALSHGINANVIRKWLPKGRSAASTAVGLLPVTVSPVGLALSAKARLSEPMPASQTPIELILPEATLRVPPGFDPAELRSILQILATLR